VSFADQKLGVEKASNDGRSSDDSLDYSVIIPAYQGLNTIGDCLVSVLQALKGRLAEVVVVESSGDGTAELIRREFPDVRVLAQAERSSAGKARNQGAEAARGKTLFFVDQDCVVPENWIDLLVEHLGEPGVGAVGGSVGIRNLNNLSGCGVYFLEFLYHFPSRRAPERNSNFLLGCNLACRASVFEAVRFPARTLAEDVLFSHAVRVAGWDTVYDPRVQVRHWKRANGQVCSPMPAEAADLVQQARAAISPARIPHALVGPAQDCPGPAFAMAISAMLPDVAPRLLGGKLVLVHGLLPGTRATLGR
jgi:cellulose synthase/poly-beta-1,6-N-acetylglucosamine synthase-like glycosyltransferase